MHEAQPSIEAFTTVDVLGMPLAHVGEDAVLDHMFGAMAERRGGWLITANLDFLRRYVKEPQMRDLYTSADLMVADGMPLVWASKVLGKALPERVAGSALIYRFAERAAREGRSMYFLGGDPGAAEAAAAVLCSRHAGLQICGTASPRVSVPPAPAELDAIRAELKRTQPALLLVGLGSPKQEHLIRALRAEFPQMWMVGVGISFSFVAGKVSRAPSWMRQSGLEWIHRLSQEPGRLARRYLIEDLPFAIELFARTAWDRIARR
jgi:N-acetylglucosaminyldiphosphoundecaprenol N-acetyl-beta-D-mannosaminyltransferase